MTLQEDEENPGRYAGSLTLASDAVAPAEYRLIWSGQLEGGDSFKFVDPAMVRFAGTSRL